MDHYGEKIREVLEKLVEGSPQHSALDDVGRKFKMSPFFSQPPFADTLMNTMKHRLAECGWKDEIALECNKIISQRGVDNISQEEIVQEVTPIARAKVPMEIKKELVAMLKDALMKEIDGTDMKP